ncbi:molybdopterin oxidoreductase family protein, partial [Pseudomonas aeruginosa]
LPRPEGALHDWEIFVGLARAFAARNGQELKPTLEPQQMIDLGPLRPNLAPRLKTADQRIQAAPPLFVDDLQRFAAQPLPA